MVEVVEGGSGSSSSSSRCHWKLFVCRLPFTVAPSPLSSSFGCVCAYADGVREINFIPEM